MIPRLPLAISLVFAVDDALARTFTIRNDCPFTVWPAMYTDPNAGTSKPSFPTGWEQLAFTTISFQIPNDWKAGRIWGRRDCDFSMTNDVNSCLSGGCNGGLECDPVTGTGVPPATLAEWTLSGDGNRDFYDVSIVDGYNIPMRITNNVNCPVADCPVDLGPSCPAPLAGPYDTTGYPLGCRTACEIDPNPQDSPNCCSGSHNTAETCPPSGVQYYDFFKGMCPNAYAYAYDESSNTALWTCDSGLAADFALTFCPPPQAGTVSSPGNTSSTTSLSFASFPSNPASPSASTITGTSTSLDAAASTITSASSALSSSTGSTTSTSGISTEASDPIQVSPAGRLRIEFDWWIVGLATGGWMIQLLSM